MNEQEEMTYETALSAIKGVIESMRYTKQFSTSFSLY